jgi:hypothetical protein
VAQSAIVVKSNKMMLDQEQVDSTMHKMATFNLSGQKAEHWSKMD